MMQFTAKQNTACSDASSCAPATCCAASACTADSAAFCKDTAILAVSFFIIILVSICLSILGLRCLLVRLVLAWGLVIIMMHNSKSAKSNSRPSRTKPNKIPLFSCRPYRRQEKTASLTSANFVPVDGGVCSFSIRNQKIGGKQLW
mgnify:CR=1 FL=1